MIIVSQDKTGITNLDNVNTLRATKTGKIISFDTSYRSEDDCSDVLGQYKTEERAKEVLQEIIKAIIEDKKLGQGKELFGFSPIPKNTYYEMPKE